MQTTGLTKSVLIVDDQLTVRQLVREVARKAGYDALLAENGLTALEMTREYFPSVIIMDIKMPVMDGLDAFRLIHQEFPEIPVILMTAFGTLDTVVETMKMGAFDYLVKPSNVSELRIMLDRAYQMRCMRAELAELRSELKKHFQLETIIGQSPAVQAIYKVVGRVAQTNATVLITGESGSGKEVIAQTIHRNSTRRDNPFIKVNCGALPEGLMESELFGHEKGAFTGAVAKKPGRFELANGGTILLDEIGELPLSLQVKLLRVLQEKTFERVGGTETIKVDVRIIAATNRNLEERVQQGLFRDDLYYRLKVVPIHVPALRERVGDIPAFVDYFVRRFAEESHVEVPMVTPEAMKLLCRCPWPGNVRELGNVMERAVILSQGVIDVMDLPGLLPVTELPVVAVPESGTYREQMHRVEKQIIENALRQNHGNRVKTAKALDISRRALLYKIDEHGLGQSGLIPDAQEIE
ncbi:MAG: sigma-54-dependent Fis family transcriptional regulator [Veillonellaceae bacterium]|jgi:two-component system response regulator AtoC|nr:sigma-54-dependent Fis family transcriptional regulator [Veillonellaceae bacterium]